MLSEFKSLPSIGFLTVVTIPDQGLVGGYLVLNIAARPLEFHCTTPVRANRAQEILYGPTLRPYLFGEQIGKTLLARSKTKPLLALTDVQDVLAARDFAPTPVVFVMPSPLQTVMSENSGQLDTDASREMLSETSPRIGTDESPAGHCRDKLIEFSLGGQRVAVSQSYRKDQQAVKECWQVTIGGFDLQEPFGRIREAIQESQGGNR